MMEEGTTVTVRIKESVKAGVVAYLEGSARSFRHPRSHPLYVEDTESWVGKEIRSGHHGG